jgi:hypothetical protein
MISAFATIFAFFLTGKAPGSGSTGVLDKGNLWGLSNYLGASETAPAQAANAFPLGSTPTAQTAAAQELTTAYLQRPELLGPAKALRDATLKNWKDLNPPYTLDSFLAAAMTQAGGDKGTALLLCVNVARAFARGGYRIYWQRLKDWEKHFPALSTPAGFTRDDYTVNDDPGGVDPRLFYKIAPEPPHHPDGHVLETERLDKSPGAAPGATIKVSTLFWLLFDARDLKHLEDSHRDPGDHYHFYSIALVAFLGATKRVTFNLPGGINPDSKMLLRQVLRDMERFEGREPLEPQQFMARDARHFGWTWANALSFIEEAYFGEADKQDEATRESDMHRKAAAFGLGQADFTVSRDWSWYVPVAGSLVGPIGTAIGGFLTAGSEPPLEMSRQLLFCQLDPQTGDVIPGSP